MNEWRHIEEFKVGDTIIDFDKEIFTIIKVVADKKRKLFYSVIKKQTTGKLIEATHYHTLFKCYRLWRQ